MRCRVFPPASLRAMAPGVVRLAALIATGALLSACAASKGASDYQSNAGAPPARLAVAAPPKVEIEADGLPAQAPPRIRPKAEPVDPSEPFSPNYGPPPENAPFEPVPAPEPLRQAGAEPDTRLRQAQTETRHLTPAEADALIARAIMAHEQRYP